MSTLRKYCLIKLYLILFVGSLTWMGCEEDLPDVEIAQFNNPQDVALVCFDNTLGPLPIDSCRNSERSDAEIFAFVTQTEFGEVAVVNLEDYKIVDQEERIPFNSFIPVGGHPEDITASEDGTHVYTANFETRDISIVDVEGVLKVENVGLQPARSVNVDYPPAQIVVSSEADVSVTKDAASDTFAFVTQPTVGRVAVVNLEAYTTTVETTDGGTEQIIIPSGVLAYLRMDNATLTEGEDPRPEGVAPWSMVASQQTASLFVGGSKEGLDGDGSYILEIQREIFIDRAKRSYESTGEVQALNPSEMVVRRMDLNEFSVRDMSIEPELERWMYIVENEKGGVIVLDLESGELVEVNAWDVTASDSYSLEVPGIAKKVKLARFAETLPEGDKPDPYTFNGTVALIATTQAAIFVADVSMDADFASQIENYSSYSHSLRSSTRWFTEPDDDEEPEIIYPEISGDIELHGDDDQISYDNPFAAMLNTDGSELPQDTDTTAEGICDDNLDGFRMVETEDSQNIYFRCDRRMTTREGWQLVYQDAVGISGVGILDDSARTDNSVVIVDEYKDFCTAGLLGPAGPNLWNAYPLAVDAGLFEPFRNYEGDIVEITSEPSPFPAESDCSVYEDEDIKRWYRVSEIIDEHSVRLAALGRPGYAPLPNETCFGQAITYVVRANNSWVLKGQQTSYLFEGSMLNGKCVPWQNMNSTGRNNGRVFEGENFENLYLKFHFNEITDLGRDITKESFDVLGFTFNTVNGYSPMSAIIGADITDIEVAPNNNLVIIDQSAKGLVLFDLIDGFSFVDDPIN